MQGVGRADVLLYFKCPTTKQMRCPVKAYKLPEFDMPKKERLLIIEDELSVAKQLKWSLGDVYDITIATDADMSKEMLASGAFSVATLDLGLPPSPDNPKEGLKLLNNLATLSPHTKVIVITGNSEQDTAIRAFDSGAFDFCAKPIDLGVLKVILDRTFRLHALEEASRQVRNKDESGGSLCGIIGATSVMKNLFSLVRKISVTDYPVLITGESGTGKELVAKAIHQLSSRRRKPFVIVNCGAIPANLLESELFGHERGAFTGAVARKTGKFETGNQGTLFLDEIGELTLDMQVKILRFLQEGSIERVGGRDTILLDIRIIAASNIDLGQAAKAGHFREDLYFRLNVVPVKLPPLRERQEDIVLLARHFLSMETKALKIERVSFSPDALAELTSHDWPGNVRELQNRIRRALAFNSGQMVQPHDLGLATHMPDTTNSELSTLQEARCQSEEKCIRKALQLTGNNITRAARLLETSRPTLHDLIKKHGIQV
jgi:two-component system NtrC family response regulator